MPRGRPRKITADDTVIDASPEAKASEVELDDFFEAIGPQGVTEVSLYRVLSTNGKQKFICSGAPSMFTEAYIQASYGGGDYMVRARLDGKYYRSKMISVEGQQNGNGHTPADELEKLRLRIQEQEMRQDTDRQAREQRMHEMMLAVIQGHGGQAAGQQMTMADVIQAVKTLNDMSGQNQVDKAVERIFSMAQKVQQLTNPQANGEGGGWLDWLKPVAAQVGTTLAPRILPFLQPPGQAAIITPAPSPAVAIAAPSPPSSEPVPPTPPPSSEPTPEQQAAQFAQAKREALAFTLGMARLNRPAEIWADFTIEQTETTSNPILARFLQEITAAENFDKWFTELQQIDPGIITQRQWFEVYFLTIRDTLTAKASETQDSD